MKMLGVRKWMLSLFLLLSGGMAVYGQERDWEVPGDHFSLEGALELFKESASPEEFERQLNSPETNVNNLDLNGDGYIDYIRVIDRQEGAVHVFILQAILAENERQDVAVISLEKLANGKAVLQITGDEDVYGMETIIEPTEEVRVNAGTSTVRTVVNVWFWPSVQYVYGPYYTEWVSPWHWSYRPLWWRPWRPVAYVVYYPRWEYYRPYYTTCHTHRVLYAQHMYRPYRTTSVVVYNRHHDRISRYRSSQHALENNRSRYTSSRENNTQSGESRNDRTTRERSRSGYSQQDNGSRSTANEWRQREENSRSRSSEKSTEKWTSSSDRSPMAGSRSDKDFRNTPASQRSTREQQQRRTTEINNNPVDRQRESGKNYESRGSQRSSSVQSERSGSPERRSSHSSGSSDGRNKSSGQRKGKE